MLVPPDPRDRQFLAASASIGMHADLGASSVIVANFTPSVPILPSTSPTG